MCIGLRPASLVPFCSCWVSCGQETLFPSKPLEPDTIPALTQKQIFVSFVFAGGMTLVVQPTLRQRFSVFVVTANYTYLYGQSDQEDRRNVTLYLPVDSYDLHKERGNTTDPRHNFTTSINSKLPLGVYLTTVLNAHSGTFYTITTGKDDNHDGVINDRPSGAVNNGEVGPSYFDVGLNFSKAYEFRRRTGPGTTPAQMNVFANLNNAFNTQHPGIPSGVMTSPFFLKSYNATSPRTMQVGMRFQF